MRRQQDICQTGDAAPVAPARAMTGQVHQQRAQRPGLRTAMAALRQKLLPDGSRGQQYYHRARQRLNEWRLGSESDRPPRTRSSRLDGSELSVVVLCLDAQPEVVEAVRSLHGQRPRPEIIVINSGIVGVESLLAGESLSAIVVESSERLMPGAARNLGIAAANGRYLAFLAADCVAQPGWVAARLESHQAGAKMVSSPVINDRPRNPFAVAAHVLLFAGRLPGTPPAHRQHYGISYDATVFKRHGHFDPALRTGEDTEFHARIGKRPRPRFDARVRTTHRNPGTLPQLLKDQFLRGRRRALASRQIGKSIHPSEVGLMGWSRAMRVLRRTLEATPGRQWFWILLATPWILLGSARYVRGLRSIGPASAKPACDSPPPVKPRRLLALLQYRNEPDLLPDYLANLHHQVDGILILDDGSDPAASSLTRENGQVLEVIRVAPRTPHRWDERRNQRLLIDCARRHQADWVIALDADERLEQGFRERADSYLDRAEQDGVSAYSLILRELWDHPDQYRSDGIWGSKRRLRLFKPPRHLRQGKRELHGNWIPPPRREGKRCDREADLILYHLAMLSAENRSARQRKYQQLDPNCESQSIGYDYLTDETGLRLEPVPADRGYR